MKERNAVRCFLIENGSVVVTRYNKENPKAGYYEIPGGKIEEKEYPRDTAIREVKEETGMDIKNLTYKGKMTLEYPDRKFYFTLFRTNTYEGTPQNFEENTSQWIEISELLSKEKRLATILLLEKPYISYLLDDKNKINMYVKVDETENILHINFEKIDDEIKPELQNYIETEIFPLYERNEPSHGINHIHIVINRSLHIAKEYKVNKNMVYTVAAYHDLGHYIDPKIHEKLSAEIFMKDKKIKEWFTKEEIQIIKEAIEDHRASSKHEPRSIYGKIVSTADRTIKSIDVSIKRAYIYYINNFPSIPKKERIQKVYEHLNDKYGPNGYAKTYLYDEEFEIAKKNFIEALSDKKAFIKRIENVVDNVEEN